MNALFAFTGKYEYYEGLYYSNGLPATTWEERYLNIFDSMIVLGRCINVTDVKGKSLSCTDRVKFHCTKIGLKPIEYFTKRKELEMYIEEEVMKADFVICRLAYFGAIAAKYAEKYHKPYVCEVVGSAWDDNWNYSLKGKLVAPYFEYMVKKTVKKSKYTIYVTQDYLQKEYPTKGHAIGISNVDIKSMDDSVLEKRLEKISKTDVKNLTLCTLAAVDVKYKGQEYVLKAMKKLKEQAVHIQYIMIGSGNQSYLKNKAFELGVLNDVIFTGAIEHSKVFDYLDDVDIYIQPSLQEGLPRAMIEALSRGLPAIGFKTAGIPELIAEEYVCRKKSVKDICDCLLRTNKKKLTDTAEKNFDCAKTFLFSSLNKKREDFIKNALNNR